MARASLATTLVCFAALLAGSAAAHDVISTRLTWSKEISRIVYRRCSACHAAGGAAMALTTYSEARPWAKAIRDEVLNRRMPPWGAMKGFRRLRNDPSLTQDEIDRIARWVEGGAPEGNPRYLPAAPTPPSPDLVEYRRIPLPEVLTRDFTISGLAPRLSAGDARITAELPDGRVMPLLWLYGYKAEWRRQFVFADPVALPRGSKIRGAAEVGADALISVRKPER